MDSQACVKQIQNGKYDVRFEEIYVDKTRTAAQRERYVQAVLEYEKNFGADDICIFSAPGRTEVCGNHTDHQCGMVLAASVNLDTIAVAAADSSGMVTLVSEGYDRITVDVRDLLCRDEEAGSSVSLIRGILNNLKERGYVIGGFRAYVTSNVLTGAGLSSSAAFEDVIGTILSGLYNDMSIDPVEIAMASQYAENVYFKKPCGLMDQLACSVGGLIHIDFEDPKRPLIREMDVDFEKYGYCLCLTDTKGSHADLTDEYAGIPLEMKKVASFLGRDYLRECQMEEFLNNLPAIRQMAGDRAVLRAFHFFQEEKNVQDAVEALIAGEFDKFLGVIQKSGDSSFKYLQNVYAAGDVSHQNISVALALSQNILGDYGVCRIHGGGFAGLIQAFVQKEFVGRYEEGMNRVFGEGSCHVLKIRGCGGIQVI